MEKSKKDEKHGYNWDYRPNSYWVGPRTALINIKGEVRRREVEKAIRDGEFESIPEEILEPELSEDLRLATGRIHPAFMGGEYLPAYLPGEVEIARICLKSVTGDVISVRAVKFRDGLIYYRVVDEYEDQKEKHYTCQPEATLLPLTFREIVSLIDSVEGVTGAGWACKGQTTVYRDLNYEIDPCKSALDDLVDFVTVSSDFYPEIGRWYREEAQEWYRKRLAELGLDQDEVDDLEDEESDDEQLDGFHEETGSIQTSRVKAYCKELLPDHPIYQMGFVVGGKRVKDCLENQEGNSNADPRNPEDEDRTTPKRDLTDLSKLEATLRAMGGKKVPHPGGVKVRIYPQPKK